MRFAIRRNRLGLGKCTVLGAVRIYLLIVGGRDGCLSFFFVM